MRTKLSARLLALGFGVGAAARIAAQEPSTGGVSSVDRGSRDAGVLTVSVTAGADSNGAGAASDRGEDAAVSDARDAQFRGNRIHSDVRAGFKYNSTPGGGFVWQIGASSGVRYYQALDEFLALGHQLSGAIMMKLGRRTNIVGSQSVGYLPSYSLVIEPGTAVASDAAALPVDAGELSPATLNFSLANRAAYRSSTSVTVTRSLAAHSSFVMTYAGDQAHFVNDVDPSLNSRTVHGQFRHQLTKYAAFHAGYGRRFGRYTQRAALRPVSVDDIDIGVDYSRPVSVSRRMTFNVTSGSSMTTDAVARAVGLTGSATLDYRIGRASHAKLVYDRSVRLLEGLSAPIFANAVTASLNGGAGRRLVTQLSAGLTDGAQVNDHGVGNSTRYRTYTGNARVSLALSSGSDLFAEYMFYQHNVGDGVMLLSGVPHMAHRSIVVVGASLRVPAIRQRIHGRK